MSRIEADDRGEAAPARGIIDAVLRGLIFAAALIVPVVVAPTHLDAFRFPKERTYLAFAILILAWLAIALLFRGRALFAPLRKHREVLWLTAAICAWSVLTTLTSTNRLLSLQSLIWVLTCALMFIATLLVAERFPNRWILWLMFVPAALNACLAVAQRAGIYNPMMFEERVTQRIRTTALSGNPNDVATYLLFPALAALAMALIARDKRMRIGMIVLALVLAAGIIVTDTITAIGALGVGVVALLITRSRRAIIGVVAVAIVAVVVTMIYAPLRDRITGIYTNVRQGKLIEASSLRLPAYLAAWEMFEDRPLLGKGPGTYGSWYLPYKLKLNERDPELYKVAVNFGETHNDHLQTLAVAGLPGYALFLAAAALLAWTTIRNRHRKPADEKEAFARLLALPLALAFLTVTLALFPLELASAMSVLLHLCAVCRVWSTPA